MKAGSGKEPLSLFGESTRSSEMDRTRKIQTPSVHVDSGSRKFPKRCGFLDGKLAEENFPT